MEPQKECQHEEFYRNKKHQTCTVVVCNSRYSQSSVVKIGISNGHGPSKEYVSHGKEHRYTFYTCNCKRGRPSSYQMYEVFNFRSFLSWPDDGCLF